MSGASVEDLAARLRAAGCVWAEDEAQDLIAEARDPDQLEAMVARRVGGLPLEHVLGWAPFCGLRIEVDEGVFVPRPRTELLVEQAVELARAAARPLVVVDLCCGSGAIGVAVASAVEGVELHAADVEPAAVRCARRNVATVGGAVHEGDLFDALPDRLRGRVDLLLANVPYVPTDAIELLPQEARLHEPLVALDGGSDGLDVLRRVTAAAVDWLPPGGHLLTETSTRQLEATLDVLSRAGLSPSSVYSDELDATVVIGTVG